MKPAIASLRASQMLNTPQLRALLPRARIFKGSTGFVIELPPTTLSSSSVKSGA
jgi:hypothetical protein